MGLENKTAIVTGGSRGIGRAICLALAKAGANVVTCYAHGAEGADETVKLCGELGVQAMAVQADVAVSEDVTRLIDAVKEKFGSIDILVNNAGITRDNLILKMNEADFDQVIDTNLKGAFLCIKGVSKLMLKQRAGRIINISSVVGVRGNAGQVNYSASKAGLIGMTKSVAKELASRGITVNAVAPGFIETDMTAKLPEPVIEETMKSIPMRTIGKGEDVANLVAFLASDEARYITGQIICVDGGMAM
ncbi:MAG: 3-oxoacyl-[acyl-carrier-protein] reductase [Clostridium sp.]|nr:3-oxoacyl-[acyl-carrier-protein] reductase [Clostridium sp.]MCM1208733.1 3-oxoacyl-[acyl-carrier-protein] reductase [Ruminococcus sp.]